MLMIRGNGALRRVAQWMQSKKLQLAPEKTGAVLLTAKRKVAPISFTVQGSKVELSKAVKYLGV